jgi:hypothetical protein
MRRAQNKLNENWRNLNKKMGKGDGPDFSLSKVGN